jgi:hypothetical protein
VVTAVLVVSFGRLGDMFGRVRMYNLGFAVFAVFSVLLSLTWMHGTAAAWWLIVMRILQGVGGAMLLANSSAILTDAFPAGERGLAGARAQPAARQPRRLPDRPHLLPFADLGAVLARPGRRVRLRDRGLPGRGRGVAATRG